MLKRGPEFSLENKAQEISSFGEMILIQLKH